MTSRLDNGNATLFGLPDNQLNRLQGMLNIAARIITLTSPINRITPILKELHWLPVKKRIEYKIVLLTFKALHGLAPQYIAQLLKPKPTPRQLRTILRRKSFENVPQARTKTFGDRAFSCVAPMLWNALPDNV